MKLISFDVGIKNMAFCILENATIQCWTVLNLMAPAAEKPQCNCAKKNGALCGKPAKYQFGGDKQYCQTHAKTSARLMPQKGLAKLSLEQLHALLGLNGGGSLGTKKAALEAVAANSLTKIVPPKQKTAGQTDLLDIGRAIVRELDQVDLAGITHVIIENQISPIATRMKTIQGMLSQYFIMRFPEAHIEFVSSSNKLNHFQMDREKTGYKANKADSIKIVRQLLSANADLARWTETFSTAAKSDDLADCFLQGLWYLSNKKIITYADDLKINSVEIQ
jgi:hypothetical protein